MGGINPILQALLNAMYADPYNHDDYTLARNISGTFNYKGKQIEYKLSIAQLGTSAWIRGMVGDEAVDVKMVEPNKVSVDITLPSDDPEKKDVIGLMFNATCDDQMRTAWERVEQLFGYAK